MSQKLFMIIGSPRLKHSTSYSIANYLKNGISTQGWTVDILFAHQAITDEKTMKEVLLKTEQADIIGIIFPLYVDSIPGPLIQVLETMSKQMTKKPIKRYLLS